MKREIRFVDKAHNRVTINIETREQHIQMRGIISKNDPKIGCKKLNPKQFMEELSITGEMTNCTGQIYEEITPTYDQKMFINFWKRHAGKKIYADSLMVLNKLIWRVQYEESERRRNLKDYWHNYDIDDPEDELKIIHLIGEEMDVDGKTAAHLYALAQYCNLEIQEIFDIEIEDDNKYTVQGIEYYIGSEQELEDIARKYLSQDTDQWILAIKADRTTKSLDDWVEDVIDEQGFAGVLNSWNGKYDEVELSDVCFYICRT